VKQQFWQRPSAGTVLVGGLAISGGDDMAKKPKKTVEVKWVLEICNQYLACNGLTAETKQGVYQVLARVLHQTGNYAGFGYNNLSDDHLPYCYENGKPVRNPAWSDEDENSRVYLYHRSLRT
jgi:hypothetical protein